jgi:hypothetical protein
MRAAARVRLAQLDDLLDRDALLDLILGVHQRLDRDDVAGFDGELGRLFRIEPTPLHGLGRGLQLVVFGSGRGSGRGRDQNGEQETVHGASFNDA